MRKEGIQDKSETIAGGPSKTRDYLKNSNGIDPL